MDADRKGSIVKRFARWRRRVIGGVPPVVDDGSKALARGDAARANRQWQAAAEAYAEALTLRPYDGDVRLQLGHMLKETGDLSAACDAYRLAAGSRPLAAEANLHLGHLLKRLDRRDDAVVALATALEANPGLIAARNALIDLDARESLPASQMERATLEAALQRAARLQADADEAHAFADALAVFPVSAWDRFRHLFPVAPPPTGGRERASVLIDARGFAPWAVKVTLQGLEAQRLPVSSVVVLADDVLPNHPLAALPFAIAPLSFAASPAEAAEAVGSGPLLILSAGVVPDPSSTAWFAWAAARSDAAAFYADHDRFRQDWRSGRAYFAPALQSAPDPVSLEAMLLPPAAVWLRARPVALVAVLERGIGAEVRRSLLLEATAAGQAVHLPRVLFSVADEAVERNLSDFAEDAGETGGRIRIVIPTRDQPDLLQAAVESFKRLARDPDRVDIVAIDNRGALANRERLVALEAAGLLRTMPGDQPFNWSALNNLGAAEGDEDFLIFANDDVEMLTPGWDDRIAAQLLSSQPMVLGARLLYPDRTVQHAGVVFGRDPNGPVHEGVGADAADGGPLDRWRRPRAASAVTGAFLACRRSTFETLGGFDPALAVAFNDLDFCLRAREAGGQVIYASDVELVHHESKSRGLNDTADRVRWDREELTFLRDRWGDALLFDPGVNPQWASAHSRVFDGYRDLSLSEISSYFDAVARPNPWKVERKR